MLKLVVLKKGTKKSFSFSFISEFDSEKAKGKVKVRVKAEEGVKVGRSKDSSRFENENGKEDSM